MKRFGNTYTMPANTWMRVRSFKVYPYQKVREAKPGI